jgi:hypothetical protein
MNGKDSKIADHREVMKNIPDRGVVKSLHFNEEWLRRKYEDEGLSACKIAEILNRNPNAVYKKLKHFGIPIRTRAQAAVQRERNKKRDNQ